MQIAGRLYLPDHIRAVLWDMDGVLVDSLQLDLDVCEKILREYFGSHIRLEREFIRSVFAYHPPEFWRRIFEKTAAEYGIPDMETYYDKIVDKYNEYRLHAVFRVNPGIREILQDARKIPLKLAVVSNNATSEVEQSLRLAGISDLFDLIVGNDIRDMEKKPAPDTYLFAARSLGIDPADCAVVEDSLVGAQAGSRAGAFTIGVATGGADFEELEQSPWAKRVYSSFAENRLHMQFGNVARKKIITPNEFVSHMLEHIAWRMGIEIDLHWNSNDWQQLGKFTGEKIRAFKIRKTRAAVLGMIDDGSAEVLMEIAETPGQRSTGEAAVGLLLESVPSLDLDWFLHCRCEQLASGHALAELLEGLAQGLGARIRVRVCSAEDPHHSWEGIFRAAGMALFQIFAPETAEHDYSGCLLEENVSQGEISIRARSCEYALVSRKTAESFVKVGVDFSRQKSSAFRFDLSPSVKTGGLAEIFTLLARAAGFTLQIDYQATVLSSGHVVLEDTGMVLGRALKEILVLRMAQFGIRGCGSNMESPEDFHRLDIRTGASVEGRKFWKFVPFDLPYEKLRREFIIGHTVCGDLFSEDLDDFLDGLAGGLGCSLIFHIRKLPDPAQGWKMLFSGLGKALQEVFAANPCRKGLPPGVKATLV